ncbi:GH116 family glycosyl hydrolase [Olivibacter sp. CPCC 100613]|uniref:alpha-L-rhamnosidase-related protein n=1 Tax=Olivibacter sp. CPCC 100613 TaxID=3079931 RepID=UPI002FFB04BB
MKNFLRIPFYYFLVIYSISCCVAQTEQWDALWIGIPHTQKDTNIWTAFRKDIDIKYLPKVVRTKIATDSKYWLWVNEKLVVFEGQLKRGPNPQDTYYDELDLAPYLSVGQNTIAVLTWYWGRDGYDHKSSGKSALLFEADLGDNRILSDSTWSVIRHPAYGNTAPPLPNYRLPEFNILFDARKDVFRWQATDFNDRSWAKAIAYGKPPIGPWHHLAVRPIPFWKDEGLHRYVNLKAIPKQRTGELIIAKLPKNITITPYLKIEATEGQKIDIRTDNYKGGSEFNVRTEYITKAGIQEFETYGYMNGHEVHYRIPKGIKIIDLQYRETRFDTEKIGLFKADDEFYNRLWEKSYTTLNVNLRDAIQDPDRERAQWWGDAVILMGEMLYACDSNSKKMMQKAIRNLIDWQKPNGVLYSPVPAGSWNGELPAQMLAAVGKYGIWNYYLYTGDNKIIHYVYPAIRRYLLLWRLGKNGLVIHREGDWDWMDWGEDIDAPLIENAWYYMALEAAINMAELTGHQSDIPEYRKRLNLINENYNEKFWNGKAYRSPSNKGATDDRGNGLAVVAGIADVSKYGAIKKVLQNEYHASPYMEKYILESLFIMHDASAALERMKLRYAKMVDSPLTTLWEGWGIGAEGYGGGSYNHGWSGGPLTLMAQYVAGIQPQKPGYEMLKIVPQPGDLKNIKCVAPTTKGNVVVELIRKEQRLILDVTISNTVNTLIGIPKIDPKFSNIIVNKKSYFKGRNDVSMQNGPTFVKEDADYFYFHVVGGKWVFELF